MSQQACGLIAVPTHSCAEFHVPTASFLDINSKSCHMLSFEGRKERAASSQAVLSNLQKVKAGRVCQRRTHRVQGV